MVLKNYYSSPATYAIGVLSPDRLTRLRGLRLQRCGRSLRRPAHFAEIRCISSHLHPDKRGFAGYDCPMGLGIQSRQRDDEHGIHERDAQQRSMTSYNSNGSFAGNSAPPVTQDVIDRNTAIMQDMAYFKAFKTI